MRNFIVRHLTGIFLLSTCLLLLPPMAVATEEYAKQTGRSCAACHLDPGGGGELTAAGKAFVDTRRAGTEPAAAGFYVKGFRLAVGYCHFLTAILWFGTILYVHLVLKPAYAASGLPRGEMRVGVVSMIVMGVTGTILTHFRVTSFAALLHSRFGILLLVKISLYLVMVLSALFVITVLGPRLKAKRHKPSLPEDTTELSADELAAFDGKEGRPARFACAGKIYDATRSPLWKQGVHMGRHNAGSDLTDALKQAPHGMEKVITLPLAGELIAAGNRKAPLHERVFFFMAHMNLTIVFIIILILSLWRWW